MTGFNHDGFSAPTDYPIWSADRKAEARKHYTEYLARFPNGPRQQEAKTRTAPDQTKGKKKRKPGKKSVLVASCDVYRPAAIQQLETLAGDVGLDFFPSDVSQDPVGIAVAAVDAGRKRFRDVVGVGTL